MRGYRIFRKAYKSMGFVEEEGRGFRESGDHLKGSLGKAYLAYRRSYEMRGLPVPPARRPGGRPRKER